MYELIYQIGKDVFASIRERVAPGPILKARLHRKDEVERNIRWIDNSSGYGQAIIRDLRRLDSYPDIDEKARPHPWYRVQIKGLFADRFLEVFFGNYGLIFENGTSSWRLSKGNETPTIPGLLVGRIPLEWIQEINWDGDGFYSFPHFYCTFRRKWGPYKQAVFYREHEGLERPVYTEIVDYATAKKNARQC